MRQTMILAAIAAVAALSLLVLGTIAFPPEAEAAGSTLVSTRTATPIDDEFFVPCANEGSGEIIHFTGTIRSVFHTTLTDNGQFILKSADAFIISGVGQTSGDLYRNVGTHQRADITTESGFMLTIASQDSIIGQGSANNLLFNRMVHLTVNPDGTTTVFKTDFHTSCK